MKTYKRVLCLLLCLLFVLGAAACGAKQTSEAAPAANTVNTDPATAAPAAVATEPPTQAFIVEKPEATVAPTPVPTPSPSPTPTPTPTPTPSPVPTREPIPGDVTSKFPTADTGVDADYSYQSDELRIAIKKVEDEELHQVYYVADIWVRNINAFRTGFGNGAFDHGTEDAENFAAREHAVLAINGSFNNGVLFHNGELVRKSVDSRYGAMVLYNDGTMKAYNVRKEGFNLTKEMKKGIRHIWQFGPVLVQDGKAALNSKYKTRHPRNIIGYYEPGHYVLVTVDGRTKKAIGMTEAEQVELMLSLGVQEAMNLDGGTSAVMTFMGQIISSPSNMGTGKSEGGRRLLDMVLFAEYDAEGNAPALSEIPAEKVKFTK